MDLSSSKQINYLILHYSSLWNITILIAIHCFTKIEKSSNENFQDLEIKVILSKH